MGMQESKYVQEFNPEIDENNDEICNVSSSERKSSIPVLTPQTPLDPRSPTVGIARTPLEVILKQGTQYDTPGNTKTVFVMNDPRSPTEEFPRTPIIVDEPKNITKIHNKNLDNVRKTLLIAETKAKITPKLLESSPIAYNPNTYKRRSMAGLLETNVDFTETDLDDIIQHKKEDLNKTLPDKITPNCVTPISNKIKQQMENLIIDPPVETVEVEPLELPVETVEFEHPVETVEEDTKVPDTLSITAQAKNFDKKLSNLIYEDVDIPTSNNVKAPRQRNQNRTPLGNRNMNSEVKKSAAKLKVSDKPRKSEANSRIPVLKKGVQCENTPPHLLEERGIRGRISKWDNDKTLVI